MVEHVDDRLLFLRVHAERDGPAGLVGEDNFEGVIMIRCQSARLEVAAIRLSDLGSVSEHGESRAFGRGLRSVPDQRDLVGAQATVSRDEPGSVACAEGGEIGGGQRY